MALVTAAGSGTTLRLPRAETLDVSLPENPTTGYLWAIDVLRGPLELDSSDFTPGGDAAPGAGGVRTLTFKATDIGRAQLGLKLWQEWEGESSVTDRFELYVDVATTEID